MRKCANFSPYMRWPLVIYEWLSTRSLWISLHMRKIQFSILSVIREETQTEDIFDNNGPTWKLNVLEPYRTFYTRWVGLNRKTNSRNCPFKTCPYVHFTRITSVNCTIFLRKKRSCVKNKNDTFSYQRYDFAEEAEIFFLLLLL